MKKAVNIKWDAPKEIKKTLRTELIIPKQIENDEDKTKRVRVATVSPSEVFIGSSKRNADQIAKYLEEIQPNTDIVVFPELCLTGYTSADLYNHELLLENAIRDLLSLLKSKIDKLVFVGLPIKHNDVLYNCAVAFKGNTLLGVIPKTYLPNYNEFYEQRWFASGKDINTTITIGEFTVPFTTKQLFVTPNGIKVGCEICEDMWVPIPPSVLHCQNGANIIVNLSASNETVGKAKYREDMIKSHSAKNMCGYIYTSASQNESTTDVVMSNHQIIANNGKLLKSTKTADISYAVLNVAECIRDRQVFNSFSDPAYQSDYIETPVDFYTTTKFEPVSLMPFVPSSNLSSRVKEILDIQVDGLTQRLKKINCQKVVLGISGGMDSTLALIVAYETFRRNNWDTSGIIGITMPGFGTSDKTLKNSLLLTYHMQTTRHTIDITKACEQHFKDINQDPTNYDITFENTQARERTQILMDIANKENAIVVGTGDLSEIALGWCTYNGDHMSMYCVNASIPKTLVRYMIETYAKDVPIMKENQVDTRMMELQLVLRDILNTPISPELLPLNTDGTIAQETEKSIGSYPIHDFTMYYFIRHGMKPSDIFNLYLQSADIHPNDVRTQDVVRKNMTTFFSRFFSQQFKRSCMPDGPKVGSICLSPRGDWRMPSDGCSEAWMYDITHAKVYTDETHK